MQSDHGPVVEVLRHESVVLKAGFFISFFKRDSPTGHSQAQLVVVEQRFSLTPGIGNPVQNET
jgi:hypothetical protein